MHLHFSHLADVITAAEAASHSQIRAFNGSSVEQRRGRTLSVLTIDSDYD